jgi:hypothetical protein
MRYTPTELFFLTTSPDMTVAALPWNFFLTFEPVYKFLHIENYNVIRGKCLGDECIYE